MRRRSHLGAVALSLSTFFTACAGTDEDPIPSGYADSEQADLSAARASDELMAAAAVPVADTELGEGIRFAADPALDESGDVDSIVIESIPPTPDPARVGREAIVAIRWGYFPGQPGADTWMDWSGFVAVSRGTVELIRPLRFENDLTPPARPAEDFVREGVDPRVVRFRSHTLPHWDGVLLRVTRPSHTPAVLVIHAGGTTRVLPFEELFDLDASEIVDDDGHELKIRARIATPDACVVATGEAAGRWGAIDADRGLFRGMLDMGGEQANLYGRTHDALGPYGLFRGVAGADGEPIGNFRGFYAAFHYSPGEGALVGVARGEDGARGAIVGRWRLDDVVTPGDLEGDGSFVARLLQRDPACAAE
jgi:hypothetical protein